MIQAYSQFRSKSTCYGPRAESSLGSHSGVMHKLRSFHFVGNAILPSVAHRLMCASALIFDPLFFNVLFLFFEPEGPPLNFLLSLAESWFSE